MGGVHQDSELLPENEGEFIVAHIRSRYSFMEDGLLLFRQLPRPLKTWCKNVCQNLKAISGFVSHHNKQLVKMPNSTSSKVDIKQCLRDKQIIYDVDMLKAETCSLTKNFSYADEKLLK